MANKYSFLRFNVRISSKALSQGIVILPHGICQGRRLEKTSSGRCIPELV